MARARSALLLACVACATVATVAADGEDEGLGSAIAKIDKLHLGFGGACGYAGGKLVKGVALSVFKTGLALYVAAHLPALLTHLGQKKLANVVAEKEKKLIAAERELEGRARQPVWNSNLQPDFNVRICDSFDASSSAVLRELDESNRFVQKSAESTSI